MKLTSFTDYSLRVLIYLAARPAQRSTIAEIAEAFDVKENHLTKVVHFLGKAGLLANVRGKGGGLGLALAPQGVTLGQVVRQTEGAATPAECFGEEAASGRCCIEPVCRLRPVLNEAVEAFYAVLDNYTLADMVRNQQSLARILFVDRRLSAARRLAS
jgi:Rrf2 family nitric oxide-sensitive transcriptional repressor